MNQEKKTKTTFEDPKINIKIKLSILWTTLVFFYLYNDVLSFFRKDTIEDVLTGAPGGVEITQAFMVAGALLMAIPIFMVFLSIVLPAKTNRPLNIILGIFHFIILIPPLTVGETPWAHYALYMGFEAIIIVLIVWYAWNWPTKEDMLTKGK